MEQVKLLLRILQNMTDLPVLTWDGQLSSLEDYEKQHLFLRQAQPLLEATALQTLLENLHPNILYGVKDPLGMELLLFRYEDCPFVIGPYTTQAWNDKEGEHTLASLGLRYTMAVILCWQRTPSNEWSQARLPRYNRMHRPMCTAR